MAGVVPKVKSIPAEIEREFDSRAAECVQAGYELTAQESSEFVYHKSGTKLTLEVEAVVRMAAAIAAAVALPTSAINTVLDAFVGGLASAAENTQAASDASSRTIEWESSKESSIHSKCSMSSLESGDITVRLVVASFRRKKNKTSGLKAFLGSVFSERSHVSHGLTIRVFKLYKLTDDQKTARTLELAATERMKQQNEADRKALLKYPVVLKLSNTLGYNFEVQLRKRTSQGVFTQIQFVSGGSAEDAITGLEDESGLPRVPNAVLPKFSNENHSSNNAAVLSDLFLAFCAPIPEVEIVVTFTHSKHERATRSLKLGLQHARNYHKPAEKYMKVSIKRMVVPYAPVCQLTIIEKEKEDAPGGTVTMAESH